MTIDSKSTAGVQQRSVSAYQFDFYIPKAIWKLRLVRSFFDALSALGGATVFDEETGIWKGGKEKTQVFRLIVQINEVPIQSIRRTVRREISRLLATLADTRHAQEAMMVTETKTRMFTATLAKGDS